MASTTAVPLCYVERADIYAISLPSDSDHLRNAVLNRVRQFKCTHTATGLCASHIRQRVWVMWVRSYMLRL